LAGERLRHFQVQSWRVIVERRTVGEVVSEATFKLNAKGERNLATGEGNGPVNALDNACGISGTALRSSPSELADYKVRILRSARTARSPWCSSESGDGTGTAAGTWRPWP